MSPESFTEPPIDVVPFIRRKLAWDMLPHDEIEDILPILGLHPASPEGTDQEHLDSHMRTLRVECMRDFLRVYCAMCAEILGTALMRGSEEHPIPEEARAQFNQQNYNFINTAVGAILAQFIDDGLLVLAQPTELIPEMPDGI